MKVLITGAAGFIGSALAWRLNSMGRTKLLLVDHLGATSQKWKNPGPHPVPRLHGKIRFPEGHCGWGAERRGR